MYIVDAHCDSIMQLKEGQPLVRAHNFSAVHPQLQMTASFSETPEVFSEHCNRFRAALARECDRIVQVRTAAQINAALGAGKHAALLTVEGSAGVRSPEAMRDAYACGVRVFGLAWHSNELATSSRYREEGIPDSGLSPLGRAVVAAGNDCGMIFDVSHLSDASFWHVLESAAHPPVATHSCFRACCAHPRNLTDEMARALASRGGMIGLNLYPLFLADNAADGTVSRYFAHLEHALALLGSDAVGFGGDIDGTGGLYPAPLQPSRSLHDQLLEEMARHNYTEALIRKLAGENWLSYLQKML